MAMNYRDFTFETVRQQFGIKLRDQALFEAVGDLVPTPWLRESLQNGEGPARVSEKACGEFIVAPILIECREYLKRGINIFSGVRLDVDAEKGLAGVCDFILARSASVIVFHMALMPIVVPRKYDMEEGVAQCAAQMVGAGWFNERKKLRLPYLYGCVTNGPMWQFLRLKDNELQIHPERFDISQLGRILWFFVQCLKDLDQQA
jgi:hypothetical protein